MAFFTEFHEFGCGVTWEWVLEGRVSLVSKSNNPPRALQPQTTRRCIRAGGIAMVFSSVIIFRNLAIAASSKWHVK